MTVWPVKFLDCLVVSLFNLFASLILNCSWSNWKQFVLPFFFCIRLNFILVRFTFWIVLCIWDYDPFFWGAHNHRIEPNFILTRSVTILCRESIKPKLNLVQLKWINLNLKYTNINIISYSNMPWIVQSWDLWTLPMVLYDVPKSKK